MEALPLVAGAATGPAGLALAATGTLLGGVASFQSGRTNAAILRRQAEVARVNAENAVNQAQVEQQDRDFVALQEIDRQRASQAASGFSLNSRSFATQDAAVRALARRDALRIRNQGEVAADNFLTEAENLRSEARRTDRAATFGVLTTFLGLGNDLLSGASRFNTQRARQLQTDSIGQV